MKMLAIDPSIEHVGLALFDTPIGEITDSREALRTAVKSLERAWEGYVPPNLELQEMRLKALGFLIVHVCCENDVGVVVIEEPPHALAQPKGQTRNKAAHLSAYTVLNRAVGAIIAATPCIAQLRPASNIPKDLRRSILNTVLRQLKRPELDNSHAADAAFVGVLQLIGIEWLKRVRHG